MLTMDSSEWECHDLLAIDFTSYTRYRTLFAREVHLYINRDLYSPSSLHRQRLSQVSKAEGEEEER